MESADLLQAELERCKKQIASYKEELETKHSFAQVLENANRAVGIISFEREIIWLNKRAEQMVGLPLAEVKGKILTDIMAGTDTDRTKLKDAVEKAKVGIISSYENIIYTIGKDKRWLKFEVHPMYNLDNIIDKACLYAIDVTKEKEYIKLINESDKRYQDLLSNTSDIIFSLDIDGIITNINEAWAKLSGYSKEEIVGKTGVTFFNANDLEKDIKARQQVLNGVMLSYSVETRLLSKTGELIWLDTICTPVYSDTKEIIGFTGISREITEQKKIQLYYELLSNNIRDLVFLIETKTDTIKYVSPSVKEIAGYDPEDLIGKNPFEFCHPDDLESVTKYKQIQMQNIAKPTDAVTFRYLKKDGTYTWIELTARIVYDESTDTVWAVSSAKVSDIRVMEEEKMAKQLEEEKRLNRIKSSFLQFVSHEFKTPLSIITSLCELIKINMEEEVNAQHSEFFNDLTSIENETEEMISLIEEVLLLEESESGRMRFSPKPLDIIDLIKKASKRVSLKQQVIEITTIKTKGAPKKIYGDIKLLEIVFLNLLSNAYKYSTGCPIPVVTVNFRINELLVSIKDFGIGIPQNSKEKLFSTFYRAENANKIDGTGLGLSIVKNLIDMHKGSIVCVTSEGNGTEMTVALPYNAEESLPKSVVEN